MIVLFWQLYFFAEPGGQQRFQGTGSLTSQSDVGRPVGPIVDVPVVTKLPLLHSVMSGPAEREIAPTKRDTNDPLAAAVHDLNHANPEAMSQVKDDTVSQVNEEVMSRVEDGAAPIRGSSVRATQPVMPQPDPAIVQAASAEAQVRHALKSNAPVPAKTLVIPGNVPEVPVNVPAVPANVPAVHVNVPAVPVNIRAVPANVPAIPDNAPVIRAIRPVIHARGDSSSRHSLDAIVDRTSESELKQQIRGETLQSHV